MAEKLTRFQLAAIRLPVDPELGLVVRASLRGEVPPPSEGTGVLAATTTGGKQP
jgi:hypothetical protein